MKLFLDDIRTPFDCIKYMKSDVRHIYEDENWDVVRCYDDFVGYIQHFGVPDVISFDHDLADEHYDSEMYSLSNSYNEKYSMFKEKTGYECAKWLCEYCLENKQQLPLYVVHSMNPIGKQNILSVLDSYKQKLKF
jgi:hypothetical protein